MLLPGGVIDRIEPDPVVTPINPLLIYDLDSLALCLPGHPSREKVRRLFPQGKRGRFDWMMTGQQVLDILQRPFDHGGESACKS